MWRPLAEIGRAPGGGYARHGWNDAELACRAWFAERAAERGLATETDRNGNLWAWWGEPGPGAVVTGSHLDSVPSGGAFDGPLGVVSAFLAIDQLRAEGITPRRPVAVAVFCEEEGARFGVACLGSRLLTGALDPARARALTDPHGVTLAEAMRAAGADPDAIGPDPETANRIGCYVELHIEQGRALTEPVGLASAIWPHGRWKYDFSGSADHAGTTRIADRRDPMLTFARMVIAARARAIETGALATVGRVLCEPNGTNAIPARITAWLDARAPDEATLTAVTRAIEADTATASRAHRTGLDVSAESLSPAVDFDGPLRGRLSAILGGSVPVLPTGAGHDAGVLAAVVPTAMLFVRNPTGVSHSPAESAGDGDCAAGVRALARVLAGLVDP
ncbi:MAG: amidase, hydantoinase/carbamoylase family [Actinomycetia bacterium]|nr:amidase, hydantoinase/carbamoylase family [Actinomycetes bacterium]